MSEKSILFIILLLWGIPSTYFRSQFRKIVYQTDDWKINIKPLFKKELIGLFGNIYPENSAYLSSRNRYRIYLFVYLVLFLMYQLSATDRQ
jgi:peroxiredoxin Q/BCP